MVDIRNYDDCHYCNTKNCITTDISAGTIGCDNCGIIHENRFIDQSLETRTFNTEGGEKKNSTRVEKSNSNDPEAIGTTLKTTHNNYTKMNNRINSSNQESFKLIEKYSIDLELSNKLSAKAKDIFAKYVAKHSLKGKSKDCFIIAILKKVCDDDNLGKTIRDLIKKNDLNKKDFHKALKYIDEFIKEDNPQSILDTKKNTVNYTETFCNKLKLPTKFLDIAKEITESVCNSSILLGRNPSTIAAASIYIASTLYKDPNIKIDLNMLQTVANKTIGTIDNSYKVICENLTLIIPEKLKYLLN